MLRGYIKGLLYLLFLNKICLKEYQQKSLVKCLFILLHIKTFMNLEKYYIRHHKNF